MQLDRHSQAHAVTAASVSFLRRPLQLRGCVAAHLRAVVDGRRLFRELPAAKVSCEAAKIFGELTYLMPTMVTIPRIMK